MGREDSIERTIVRLNEDIRRRLKDERRRKSGGEKEEDSGVWISLMTGTVGGRCVWVECDFE